tara:strand:+ start:2891 stop:3145 length:255 start_codon:yes stop_codon:yes gene_type:complete
MFKTITLLKAIQLARAVYTSVSIEEDSSRENVKITKKDAQRVLGKYLADKSPDYSLTWENEADSIIASFFPSDDGKSGILHIGR